MKIEKHEQRKTITTATETTAINNNINKQNQVQRR